MLKQEKSLLSKIASTFFGGVTSVESAINDVVWLGESIQVCFGNEKIILTKKKPSANYSFYIALYALKDQLLIKANKYRAGIFGPFSHFCTFFDGEILNKKTNKAVYCFRNNEKLYIVE